MDVKLARNLLARRRLYFWPVATGLVAALFVISTGFDPGTLTATTREAVRRTASAFYPGLSWPHAATLVMLVYQGPYVVGLFGSILGFTLTSVLVHGWQFGSVTNSSDFEHGASRETVEAILAVVTVHGVALTLAAYVPAVLYVASEVEVANPFGAWVALGPVLVVGATVAGGLALAVAGVVEDAVARGAVALFAFVPPFAGLQYAHVAPTRHLRVGFLAVGAVLAAFGALGWRLLESRGE